MWACDEACTTCQWGDVDVSCSCHSKPKTVSKLNTDVTATIQDTACFLKSTIRCKQSGQRAIYLGIVVTYACGCATCMPLPCGLQHRMVLVYEIARVLTQNHITVKNKQNKLQLGRGRVKGTGEGAWVECIQAG